MSRGVNPDRVLMYTFRTEGERLLGITGNGVFMEGECYKTLDMFLR